MPKVVKKIVREKDESHPRNAEEKSKSPPRDVRASALGYEVEDLDSKIKLENVPASLSFPGHLPFAIPKNSGRRISVINYPKGIQEVLQTDQTKLKDNMKIFEHLMYSAAEKMEEQAAASGVVFAPRTTPNTPNDPDRLLAHFDEMIQAGCYPKLAQAEKENTHTWITYNRLSTFHLEYVRLLRYPQNYLSAWINFTGPDFLDDPTLLLHATEYLEEAGLKLNTNLPQN